MTEDWSQDVRKYVPDADEGVIAAIVRHCGIALQNRDSSLVSFADQTELDRVRENYLKKKLGLSAPDSELDASIAAVGGALGFLLAAWLTKHQVWIEVCKLIRR